MRGRRFGKTKLQPTQFIVSVQDVPDVTEGASGATTTISIPVQRSGNIGYAGSVDWTVGPTGTNPATTADFGGAFPTGTLTFGGNDLLQMIDLTIHGNNAVDGDRTFMVTLSNVSTDGGSGMALIAVAAIVVKIIDDDTPVTGGGAMYNGNDALYLSNLATYGDV